MTICRPCCRESRGRRKEEPSTCRSWSHVPAIRGNLARVFRRDWEGLLPQVDSSPRRRRLMPEKETLERAGEDKEEGKAPSTQAGEFVREEIEHVREGKHGARSTKQAIAIGLSK